MGAWLQPENSFQPENSPLEKNISQGCSSVSNGHCLEEEQSSCSAHMLNIPSGTALNIQVSYSGSAHDCPERKRFPRG